jgi:hypothetical protein
MGHACLLSVKSTPWPLMMMTLALLPMATKFAMVAEPWPPAPSVTSS